MSKYPEVITADVLAAQAHISASEVLTDIADTEREISELEQRWEADKLVQHFDRLASVRVSTYPERIAERRDFVAFLKRLSAARKE